MPLRPIPPALPATAPAAISACATVPAVLRGLKHATTIQGYTHGFERSLPNDASALALLEGRSPAVVKPPDAALLAANQPKLSPGGLASPARPTPASLASLLSAEAGTRSPLGAEAGTRSPPPRGAKVKVPAADPKAAAEPKAASEIKPLPSTDPASVEARADFRARPCHYGLKTFFISTSGQTLPGFTSYPPHLYYYY